MAGSAEPVTAALSKMHPAVRITGGGALLLILALTIGAVILLAFQAQEGGALKARDLRVLQFTTMQACLSALISTLLAIPLARALSRRRFPGREAVIMLLGAPFLLPVIVAILGIVAIWGRSGLVSEGMIAMGFGRVDIYGLPGILLAHVFFNLPLATRLLLQAFADIPAERWRLAAQLGIEGRALFRLLEWPALRAAAPGAFALIFLICATSFPVVLALGGGPRATTLELAIYQAMRFDFDLARAALLAALQFALCIALALFMTRVSAPAAFGPGLSFAPVRYDGATRAARLADQSAIILALIFLGAPLIAAIIAGLRGITSMGSGVWGAAGRSLFIAPMAALVALALALSLAAFITGLERRHAMTGRMVEALGLLTLAVSPFVAGVALFIALRPFISIASIATPLLILVNAMMSLPFALRFLLPPLREVQRDYGPLSASLGMNGIALMRLVYFPQLRRPLGFSAGLAAALAMGDLGVVTLFSAPDAPTLPLYMYSLMAAHRLEAAGGVALLLTTLGFSLFLICDRWGRHVTD